MGEAEGLDSLLSCFCPAEVVTSLSQCYSALLDSMNAEIRIRWLQIVVRNDYYPDLHRVRRFLESQVGLALVQGCPLFKCPPIFKWSCSLSSFAQEPLAPTLNHCPHPPPRLETQVVCPVCPSRSTQGWV